MCFCRGKLLCKRVATHLGSQEIFNFSKVRGYCTLMGKFGIVNVGILKLPDSIPATDWIELRGR